MCMCKVWKCVCSGEGKGGVVWCCVVNQEGGRRGGAWHGVANKTPSCTRARERDRERPHTSFLNIRLRSLPPPQRAAAAAWWSCLPPTNFINTPTPTHPHTSTPAHPLTPSAHPLTHTLLLHTPSAMFKPPWVPEELSGRQPQSPAPRTHVQTQLDRMRNADPSVKSAGIPNVDPDQGQYCACHAPAESARGERRAKRSVPALTFC